MAAPDPRLDRSPGARGLITTLVALVILGPASAEAFEVEGITSARLFRQVVPEDLLYAQLRLPSLTTTIAAERSALQLHGLVEVRHRPVDALGLRIGLDTGLLELDLHDGQLSADGRPVLDRFKETGFLGETSADLQLGDTGFVELRLGKLRPRVGAGAIFDAYGLGLSVDADLRLLGEGLPLEAQLVALLPDATFTDQGKQSPLLGLQVGLHLLEVLVLRAHSALYVDGGDGLSPLLADAYARGRLAAARRGLDKFVADLPPRLQPGARAQAEAALLEAGQLYNAGLLGYDVSTQGTLGYLGLEAEYRDHGLTLSGLFLWAHGSVDTTILPNATYRSFLEARFARLPRVAAALIDRQSDQGAVTLDGLLARVTARLELPAELEARAFGLYVSGDRGLLSDDESDRRYDAFVALAPLINPTAIFFNGGIAWSQASPTVVSPAPDGAGVLAAGLGLSQRPWPWLELSILGATLWSEVPAPTGARAFGNELDLAAILDVFEPWAFTLEGGLFAPGAYFGDRPLGYQVIGGAQLYFQD